MAVKPRLLVIAGPTASGKSSLALDLAEACNGEIINADSMQVYRDLQILTARPGPKALARVPHRLYGVLDGSDLCSAARWATLARDAITQAAHAGRLPILVGGTGLYIRTLTQGIAAVPEISDAVRSGARTLHAELGPIAFHDRLRLVDPDAADRLHPSDSQRMIRAFEVVTETGRTLSDWQQAMPQSPSEFDLKAFLLMPERARLYAQCDRRFLEMMEAGALGEARALMARNLAPALPIMKALGVPELMRHLRGEMSLETAVAAARAATRRYAKRQTTWFRHQMPGTETLIAQLYYNNIEEIFNKIRFWG